MSKTGRNYVFTVFTKPKSNPEITGAWILWRPGLCFGHLSRLEHWVRRLDHQAQDFRGYRSSEGLPMGTGMDLWETCKSESCAL